MISKKTYRNNSAVSHLVMVISQAMFFVIIFAASVNGVPTTDRTKPPSVNTIHQNLLAPPNIDLFNTYPLRFSGQSLIRKGSSGKPVSIYPYMFVGRSHSGRHPKELTGSRNIAAGKRSRKSLNISPQQLPVRFPETGTSRFNDYPYQFVRRMTNVDADVARRLTASELRKAEDAFMFRNRFLRGLSTLDDGEFFIQRKDVCSEHPEICTVGGR